MAASVLSLSLLLEAAANSKSVSPPPLKNTTIKKQPCRRKKKKLVEVGTAVHVRGGVCCVVCRSWDLTLTGLSAEDLD